MQNYAQISVWILRTIHKNTLDIYWAYKYCKKEGFKMFEVKDNKEIGAYIEKLNVDKFPNKRQFSIE